MTNIAFLTAANMLVGHSQLREDHWELDFEFDPIEAACTKRGMHLQLVVWDKGDWNIDDFDAFIVGTTWDYARKPQEFLATLARIEAKRPLFNPLPAVRWNLNKNYLQELAQRGAPVIPTLWRERAGAESIQAAFDELNTDEIVIKPTVGAGAWRQARLKRGEPIPNPGSLPPAETMIQPFLPAAATEGEYSFLFFDGIFSHCALKQPKNGDYRVQSIFGGKERIHQPSPQELTLAQRVVDCVDWPLLYARVDMMRGQDGQLAVMELEIIEPYLYPEQGPDMGENFAAALERKLGR